MKMLLSGTEEQFKNLKRLYEESYSDLPMYREIKSKKLRHSEIKLGDTLYRLENNTPTEVAITGKSNGSIDYELFRFNEKIKGRVVFNPIPNNDMELHFFKSEQDAKEHRVIELQNEINLLNI